MNIKLIATDIDSTILPPGEAVSDYTLRCVQKCRERGITFTVCTARWHGATFRVSQRLGLNENDIIIANTGNHVLKMNGDTLWCRYIPREMVQAANKILLKYCSSILSGTESSLLMYEHPNFRQDNSCTIPTPYGKPLQQLCLTENEFLEQSPHGCLKLRYYPLSPQHSQQCSAELKANGIYADCLEIGYEDMNKGAGVQQLAKMLGVTREEIMTFGDGMQDTTMFAISDWSFAVENAADEVKAMAKMIAPPCTEDGVAQTIYKYVLANDRAINKP